MSEKQRQIYQTEGDRYEALVAREDYLGNIPQAIDQILNVRGLDALDLGAGTGRLTLMLAPRVRAIGALDISAGMLRVCRDRLAAGGFRNRWVAVGDHRRVPVRDGSADLVVSGWSVSYLAVWSPEKRVSELDVWLEEMGRVLRPDGTLILFESLGTGNESPLRLEHMESTYDWLDARGFQNNWIRTDYKFDSVEEAADLAGFFFGEEMATRIREKGTVILPECTGVWWMKL